MAPRTAAADQPCPCGSEQTFAACCQPFLGGKPAPTAEALMRSRYTAFVVGDYGYVERTLSPEALVDFSRAELEETTNKIDWIGLNILATEQGGPDDSEGIVEFTARFKGNGQNGVHHERSQFRKDGARWLYVDGVMDPKGQPVRVTKIGRNDPCPCGSGKKYKKCCAT
ncbi:MAG TPA: YchJ family protein [Alphaproteobacteria bacterium]|jgi:SEC-C motif-containing protein